MLTFKDAEGTELTRLEVETIASDIIRGSLGRNELIEFYVANITDEALIEWATDENGVFPND